MRSILIPLVLVSTPLVAQEIVPTSCTEADSLLGPAPEKGMKKIKGKYRDVEGITTYDLAYNSSEPLLKDGTMEFRVRGTHEGKGYSPPMIRADLEFEVIATSDNAFKDQDLAAKSQAEALQELPVLVDDSIRFRLLASKAGAKESNSLLVGRKRVERFMYDLSEEQILRLASATSVKIRAGDRTLKMDHGDFGTLRSFYRNAICNGGLASQSSE